LSNPGKIVNRQSPIVIPMTAPNHRWRNFKNVLMQIIAFTCAILVVMPLVLVFYHLAKLGFSSINLAFFTQLPKPVGEAGGGMANAIVGTFVLLAQAALIGVPVGVLGGVFLSEYGGTKLNWWIRFTADILNGVPSITWGIVVYALLVAPHLPGFSALAGGVVLGMMMIPLVMRTTEEVLQLVPGGYREAALALGIAKWKTIVQIVIRTALKGIVTGVMLALARVAGETAPLLFTALGNQYWAHKLTEPISAMPLQIFAYAISPYDDWHRQAWAGALVLLVLVLAINIGVRFLTRDRLSQRI
jgi:phosphate transport system permease protein